MDAFHAAGRARPFRSLILPLILVLGGCGSQGTSADDLNGDRSPDRTNDGSGDDTDTDGDGSSKPGTSDPSSRDDGGAPLPPCDEAKMSAVQASIDAVIPDTIDAVAFVKEACGERYFTHGPSKYPITTPHRIASNTKMYVASLILLLAEDGLLTLDDPIAKWANEPEKVPGGNAVTIRQALHHTSGLYNYVESSQFQSQAASGKKFTPEELVGFGFSGGLYFQPGTGFHYSNTNYIILGLIAERAGKLPLEQLLRKRILEPIGAKSSYLDGKETGATVAAGKSASGGPSSPWDPSTAWAAGAEVATVEDLGRWTEVRGNKTFHSKAGNDALFDIVTIGSADVRYGAGMFVLGPNITHGGGVGVGHAGDFPGYHSWALYFADKKTTIAVVVDSDASPPNAGGTYSEKLRDAVLEPLFAANGAP